MVTRATEGKRGSRGGSQVTETQDLWVVMPLERGSYGEAGFMPPVEYWDSRW